MKRWLSLVLTLLLLTTLWAPSLSATGGIDDHLIESGDLFRSGEIVYDADLLIGNANCDAGGEVNVSVRLNPNPGVCALVFHVAYDTTALRVGEVTSSSFETSFSPDSTGATIALYHLEGDVTTTGSLAEITFLSLGKIGNYTLTPHCPVGQAAQYNETPLTLRMVNGEVVVDCEHYYTYERTIPSTCAAPGRVIYSCRKCGATQETELERLAHTSGEWRITTNPTCTEPGVYGHYCAVCGQVYESNVIAATGHSFGDWMVDEPASCTATGTKVRVCTVCGTEQTAAIAATGHSNYVWRTTDPAGCTVGGTASRVCEDCGAVLETQSIPATGHLYRWVVTEPATCSSTGVQTHICVICGAVEQTAVLEKTPHVAGEWRVKTPAACGIEGEEELHCADCDAVMETRAIPALTHEEDRIMVTQAPTATTTGTAEYRCKHCGMVMRTEVIPVSAAAVNGADIQAAPGENIRVPISLYRNPGFVAGLIEVHYSTADLIYNGYDLGTVAPSKDVQVGSPSAGTIRILIYSSGTNQLNGSTITKNGVVVYLKFTLTGTAKDNTVDIEVDPNGGFTNNLLKLVYFTANDCRITVEGVVYGDASGDGVVDTMDLAMVKKELAGLLDLSDLAAGSDCNGDGVVDTIDLTLLKKYLAGLISTLGPAATG